MNPSRRGEREALWLEMQEAVQSVLQKAVDSGAEQAVQMAVYWRGELVVDAWAAPEGCRIDGETLFPAFSTGKGIAATAIHRLVERGILSWDEPIARWWPEFACNGKEGITLRHVLSHGAGLPQLPQETLADPCNWDAICRALAELRPLHPPGERRHYHAVTYGWLLGEPARRALGRDWGTILQDEVCRPLGITGMFFGLPEGLARQIVDVVAPPPPPAQGPPPTPDPVAAAAIPPAMWPLEEWIKRPDVRRACIPASNGFMNARSIARHYAALLEEGVDGVRLLSPQTVEAATRPEPVASETDVVRWGLGYNLRGGDDCPGAAFGHAGYGGSVGFADKRRRLAVGGVKSLMTGEAVFAAAVELIHRKIGDRG